MQYCSSGVWVIDPQQGAKGLLWKQQGVQNRNTKYTVMLVVFDGFFSFK